MSYEMLGRQEVFHGKAFDVDQVKVSMPDGRAALYDLVRHPGAVVILPVDSEGRILLVRQYRVGADAQILELPAGTLEPGEPPQDCAAREVREEVGMAARSLQALGGFYIAAGYSNEYIHVFLATDLYPAPLEGDADEFIDVVEIPVAEAYAMAARGEIIDSKTLATLMLARTELLG
jgi:ADP-ribose pyrophosphatase